MNGNKDITGIKCDKKSTAYLFMQGWTQTETMPAETMSFNSYLTDIKKTLLQTMCIQHFSSQTVERHTKPEIEIKSCEYAVFPSKKITRSLHEEILFEPSINSVRVSIKIKKMDDIDALLCHKFAAFLTQRAEKFVILRRKPVEGYDISFLITNQHLTELMKESVAEFIVTFLQEVDKEISEMKIGINARARGVAEIFLRDISA